MAFQDFDLITERRKTDRRNKLKKRIAIGAICAVVLIGLIGAAAFVVVTRNEESDNKVNNNNKKSPSPSPKGNSGNSDDKQVSTVQKMVKSICNATDYKTKCETGVGKEVQKDPKSAQPKDILKASIQVAKEQVIKAINKTVAMNFQTEKEKGALEDCKKLLDDAIEELGLSSTRVGSLEVNKLSGSTSDLNSWLSAVISYQQTCVDGFEEGKLKSAIKDAFEDAKEYVSNSLAIVEKLTSVVSSLEKVLGSSRRLLNNEGVPEWMSDEERRMLKAADDKPTPNVTVAADGSGQFKTISEALAAVPQKYQGRYVVYVKAGIYDEVVTVEKRMVNLTLYGDGSQKSIITGKKNFIDGTRTFQTASFVAVGDGFLGKAMGFRNTAGPEKHQAVAARIQADRAVFVNCRFEGYQDTLYAQTHRQFYRSCVITGTIDFIFGDASVVFQNCIMNVRKPLDNQQNIVTAQGRVDKRQTSGTVLQNCQIKADDSLAGADKGKFKSYLGRPWKEYSRTIVMESEIDDLIVPEGWLPWEGDFALSTLVYGEFNNTGAGAATTSRVKWGGYKVLNKEDASLYTVEKFLIGDWISGLNVPVQRGLYD